MYDAVVDFEEVMLNPTEALTSFLLADNVPEYVLATVTDLASVRLVGPDPLVPFFHEP
ncbi:hypothetical protein ABS315_16705 [Peribacillus frigoritolerans]|uniref:hypothetical protein n=1 Tax=Peribacillus frigoritolerans TaxID=450367 RepID=UPI0034E0CE9E